MPRGRGTFNRLGAVEAIEPEVPEMEAGVPVCGFHR